MTASGPEQFARKVLGDIDLIAVDVGAAHFLPANFQVLERIATLCLVEPHKAAAEELERKYARLGLKNVKITSNAAASTSGSRTLYVTNVPSSSSLLKPKEQDYFDIPDYVYPVIETLITTRRLADILSDLSLPRADAIKIDVQGAELEVLSGLGRSFAEDTLMVELEIGFPGSYQNQPGFCEINAFMTASDFVLFDLRPARHHRAHKGDRSYYPRNVFRVAQDASSLSKRIDEADALYFRSAAWVLLKKDMAALKRLIVMQCAYGFFIDACELLDRAREARLVTDREALDIRGAIIGWHRATRDIVTDSTWFAVTSKFARLISRSAQRRLLGKRFWRWLD